MPWLNIPHLQQPKDGWCLPACVAMVTAYLQQPLLQADVARWLQTDDNIGTPFRRIQRLTRRGFEVTLIMPGSLDAARSWLKQQIPLIILVSTGELSYWSGNFQHTLILAGETGETVHVFDPGIETAPMTISTAELLLAWSNFDFSFAVIEVSG